MLGAFSVGYVLFMAFGGLIVDMYGAFVAVVAAAAVWSFATGATACAGGLASLLTARLLVGVGESPLFTAAASAVRSNFPATERGRATAIFDAGSYIGTAISAPFVVFIMLHFGWRTPFLACSVLGAAFIVAWNMWMPQSARKLESRSTTRNKWHQSIFTLATSRAVIVGGLGFFCYNYGKSFFLTWLPIYLVRDRSISIKAVGVIGALPAVTALLGESLGGWAVDQLLMWGTTLTLSRKIPVCFGLFLGGALALVPLVASDTMAIIILCLAFAGITAASPGIWTMPGDIAPSVELVGTVGGIQNTMANFAGFIAPVVTASALSTTGNFNLALVIAGAVCITGAIAFGPFLGPLGTDSDRGQ